MTEGEFSACHPAQYAALVTAWNRKERRESRRFAAFMAFYGNAHLKRGASPFTADDFLGGRPSRHARRRKGAQAGEAFFKALVAEGLATVRTEADG